MAKELPYFKHEPSEWLEGEIQVCSDAAIVCFTNLRDGYWLKLGCISYAFALHKYCRKDAIILQELIDNGIVDLDGDKIIIKFLDEQLEEFQNTSDKRRHAANKRWNDASAMQVHSKSNAIREDKRREDNKKEQDVFSFDEFWNKYPKKVGKEKCKGKYNKLSTKEQQLIKDTLDLFLKYKPFEDCTHPNPETYLNQKRWEDEIPAEKPKQATVIDYDQYLR